MQELAVPASGLGRIARAGVLLDHHMVREPACLQRPGNSANVCRSISERAKHVVPKGLEEAPTVSAGTVPDRGIDVFQVKQSNVPDVLTKKPGGIAAAVSVMPGIETQIHERLVQMSSKGGKLQGRLDIGADVVVIVNADAVRARAFSAPRQR